jgi:glycosyltransferase involved in cell wall biosynthesis
MNPEVEGIENFAVEESIFGLGSSGSYRPKVSVVINTLNRGWILERSIQSLRYQDYDQFEVIVVNGPSSDNTDTILARIAEDIKIESVAEANLSKSRNAGIAAASGEIVLFLDDDAFAEPGWITNIVLAYRDDRVAGVGTRVWDHFGFNEQMNPRFIDEHYAPIFESRLPGWAFHYPDSLTIPHILGASSSFRRQMLMEIGGFDEEIEYFLDESEVCRRIAERGGLIQFLESGSSVHHKYSPGVVRDERKLLTNPYPVVKNKFYVAISDAKRRGRSISTALSTCQAFAEDLLKGAKENWAQRTISESEFARFSADVLRGVRDGRNLGLEGKRKSVDFSAVSATRFKPFPRLRPQGGARSFCFICRYLPQDSPGGVAKFTYDLAKGFAKIGHDVSVITEAKGRSEILYRDGIWIRMLSIAEMASNITNDYLINFESGAARDNYIWSSIAHADVMRIRCDRALDLVVAPVWNTEGLHCLLDDSIKTVLTLQTTFRTFSEIEWKNLDSNTVEELLILERIAIERAFDVHAISAAIKKQVSNYYKPRDPARWVIAHLGVDELDECEPLFDQRDDGVIKISYVSRLEERKGTDTFLNAIALLMEDFRDVHVEIVGRDTKNIDNKSVYRDMVADLSPFIRNRISFLGEVSDDDLRRVYSDTDIFCVPSRFESFGLIYLEAMRAGKPVVACKVGGVPELVEDGITGLLVNSDSVTELRRALERLVMDADLRRKFGEAGRQRFLSYFTSRKMVERTLAAYRNIIDG